MNDTERGVLQQSKLLRLCIHLLMLSAFCLTSPVSAETSPAGTPPHETNTQKHHAFIIYSEDDTLQSNIIKKLSDDLNFRRPGLVISKLTPDKKITAINSDTDIIIAIGPTGMQSANKHYPEARKLFISTDPEKFKLDTNTNKNDAILYMTQSYCKQMQFIKLINQNWKVIGILDSQKKPINTNNIQECARNYDLETFIVNTTADENMTGDIKKALSYSDVLLALPNKSIYNSSTIKNILLTSYRFRKPIIAFSQNFADAGALASIHSSIEQVGQSASSLVDQYYKLDHQFKNSVNHPQSFDISINRQVFRALDLSLPDIDALRQTLQQTEPDKSGQL